MQSTPKNKYLHSLIESLSKELGHAIHKHILFGYKEAMYYSKYCSFTSKQRSFRLCVTYIFIPNAMDGGYRMKLRVAGKAKQSNRFVESIVIIQGKINKIDTEAFSSVSLL